MVCESPVELRLNGRSHTILMATPVLLEELALGYCLSEGVVEQAGQVEGMTAGQVELPAIGPAHWVDVSLSPELARRAKLRRMAPAATSCALCGLESFRDLPGQLTPVADSGLTVDLDCLFGLLGAMEAGQSIFKRTGGTHAAALGMPQGRIIGVAEDIGRHNALDKALGLALRGQGQAFDPGHCLAMLSGRLSYEMALKVARVGIPLVASVSAPTALCVALLERLNITLVAFCRPPRATVYTHPRRVAWSEQPQS
ncbi:MAG: formate dehydrogenase accessory sulfurtransferase FdhD [Desulfarculus sp.]|nr:formate dehydrogenase accessory sulfurtransferase FdhD [Desulfarculus sp.]